MDTQRSDRKTLRDLAKALGFDLEEDRVEEAIDAATKLGEAVDQSDETVVAERLQRESVGSMAADEYNALLDVYDDPRTSVTDGPLVDLTVAVKDVIAVSDLRMTCGAAAFSCVPLTDATVVERLLDAGARLIGKANTDAFAFGPTGEFSERGDVVNPTAPDRVPGGSSSGSAAAVAGGLVDVALGTDTGGSVRIPAACCGVVGVKPTHSLVPRRGFVDLAPSTDTIGPFASDVKTAARTLDVIAGPDPRDPTSARVTTGSLVDGIEAINDLSIGVPTSFLEVSSEPVSEAMRNLINVLETRDEVDVVEEIDVPLKDIDEAYPLTLAAEFAWVLRQSGVVRGQGTEYSEEWRQILSMYRESLNEHIAMRVLPAAYLDEITDGRSYVQGREEAQAFQQRLDQQFQRYDVFLVPTLRILPPERGEITATEGLNNVTGNTAPFSLTGNPVASVPAGDVDDVPFATQVVAPPFDDATALKGARLIERAVA